MATPRHPNPEHWKVIRVGALARDRGCRVCASLRDLETHHRTYERFGNERLDDVTTLCKHCHEMFTRAIRMQRQIKAAG